MRMNTPLKKSYPVFGLRIATEIPCPDLLGPESIDT